MKNSILGVTEALHPPHMHTQTHTYTMDLQWVISSTVFGVGVGVGVDESVERLLNLSSNTDGQFRRTITITSSIAQHKPQHQVTSYSTGENSCDKSIIHSEILINYIISNIKCKVILKKEKRKYNFSWKTYCSHDLKLFWLGNGFYLGLIVRFVTDARIQWRIQAPPPPLGKKTCKNTLILLFGGVAPPPPPWRSRGEGCKFSNFRGPKKKNVLTTLAIPIQIPIRNFIERRAI